MKLVNDNMQVLILLLVIVGIDTARGKYVLETRSVEYGDCSIRREYRIRSMTENDIKLKLDVIDAIKLRRSFSQSVISHCRSPAQAPEPRETGVIIPDPKFDNVVYVQTENGFYALWLYGVEKAAVLSPIPPKAVASLGGLGKKSTAI